MFLNDTENEYYVYAWTNNGTILYLDYGKDDDYLTHKPDLKEKEGIEIEANATFPYKDLTEKEAFILSRYEKIKMEKFGYTKITDIGVLT